jgi:hypothetical protein
VCVMDMGSSFDVCEWAKKSTRDREVRGAMRWG